MYVKINIELPSLRWLLEPLQSGLDLCTATLHPPNKHTLSPKHKLERLFSGKLTCLRTISLHILTSMRLLKMLQFLSDHLLLSYLCTEIPDNYSILSSYQTNKRTNKEKAKDHQTFKESL